MNWLCQIIINDNTSQVLLNTSIALVTIFIPVAISLFETNKESDFKILDSAVILDHLVNGKIILWELSLLFIPIFLWNIDSMVARFIALASWSLGVYFAVNKLSIVYSWIRGNRYSSRFAYLKYSNINQEAEDLWRSVWETKNINRENEDNFFKIFNQKINNAFSKEDIYELRISLKLIQDFNILINKRDILFLTSKDNLFAELLKWHYLSWEREFSNMPNDKDINKFSVYTSISSTLDEIFKKILERSLESNFSYGFFNLIDEHIKKHKDSKVIDGNHEYYYRESFLSIFYSKFFDLIGKSNQKYDIWNHYFPKSLKIDEDTIKEPFAFITLDNYIQWAIDRIRDTSNKKYDSELENVSREIFPSVEPIFWSIMMTFLMRSWEDNRFKSLIENKRSFGFIGRIFSWSGSINEEIDTTARMSIHEEQQLKDSVALLCKLFSNQFSLSNIDNYIEELNKLNYSDNEIRELYRKQVLKYMELIKAHLEKIK